jgi:hypothetical protein
MMNSPQPTTDQGNDATLAGSLGAAVQRLQENRNRFGGRRELQGAPIGGEAKSPAAQGAKVLSAVAETRNEQYGNNRQQLPQILAHLKEREAATRTTAQCRTKDKHQAALEKARQYQAQKKKNKTPTNEVVFSY